MENIENKNVMEGNGKSMCCEDITYKFHNMRKKMLNGIDQAFKATAEKLDDTAESMHKTAGFLRHRNTHNLMDMTKKHPGKVIVMAVVLGILLGKILNK